MFWDATFSPSPKIEALLNKDNVTLIELLDDEEILQECKSQNTKLVQFLNRPDILEELVTLITTEPPSNVVETLRFKHSNIACEILTSDVPSLNRSLVADENVLHKLYSFLEQEPPLNPLLTSFFTKTFGMLLAQKQKQDWFTYQFVCVTVLEFLKSRDNFVDTVLKHIYTPVILDLLFHIVTQVEGPDLKKTLYDWFMEQKLVEKLIGILGTETCADKHLNVAQFLIEYLIAARTKRQGEKQGEGGFPADPIMDVLESKETVELLLKNMLKDGEPLSESAIVAGINIILALFEENLLKDNMDDPALQYLVNAEKEHHQKLIGELIEIMKTYVDQFHGLLLLEPTPIVDRSVYENEVTPEPAVAVDVQKEDEETINVQTTDEAKGVEDAKTEKEVQVVKKEEEEAQDQQQPSNSGDGAESEKRDEGVKAEDGVSTTVKEDTSVVVVVKRNNFTRKSAFGNTRLQICCLFTVLLETEDSDIINAICASNFFKTLLNLFKQYCWNNFLHSQVKKCLTYALSAYDEEVESGSTKLVLSPLQKHLIEDCQLAPQLVQCWRKNEEEQVEKNGHRLGYMGHLIAVFESLVTNYNMSDSLRALVDSTLTDAEELALWKRIIKETEGDLDVELDNQKKYLADYNPFKDEMKPQDFFIQNAMSFQDLEANMSSTISENLDNFLSKYISSDLSSQFFSTMKNWSSDGLDENLDEFEDILDNKNWSKFDDESGGSASNPVPLFFTNPWDTDDSEVPGGSDGPLVIDASLPKAAEPSAGLDPAGWANFSSANFADFDSHFNPFPIDTFIPNEEGDEEVVCNATFDKIDDDSEDTLPIGDSPSNSFLNETPDKEEPQSPVSVTNSDFNAKNESGNEVTNPETAKQRTGSDISPAQPSVEKSGSDKLNLIETNNNVIESQELEQQHKVAETTGESTGGTTSSDQIEIATVSDRATAT